MIVATELMVITHKTRKHYKANLLLDFCPSQILTSYKYYCSQNTISLYVTVRK